MSNQIKLDVEITDEDDKMVSSDTEISIDLNSLDIDHWSLKQLLLLLRNTNEENIQFVQRDKNVEFQTKFEISETQLKREIKSLNSSDYCDGPLDDYDTNRKHPVWVFKKYVQNIYCYIKIKIINHGKIVIVISFHEGE